MRYSESVRRGPCVWEGLPGQQQRRSGGRLAQAQSASAVNTTPVVVLDGSQETPGPTPVTVHQPQGVEQAADDFHDISEFPQRPEEIDLTHTQDDALLLRPAKRARTDTTKRTTKSTTKSTSKRKPGRKPTQKQPEEVGLVNEGVVQKDGFQWSTWQL